MVKTDIEQVKSMARCFLNLPIREKEGIPAEIAVDHPFFTSALILRDNKAENILLSPRILQAEIDRYELLIGRQTTAKEIFWLINSSHRLGFLKYTKPYLSKRDFSELLSEVWISTENPNQDPNCSIATLIRWFRSADPAILMDSEEYHYWTQLPEQMTVYRGVAVGRNPKGLSWTPDHKVAAWFAHRFDTGQEAGYIQKATIAKKDALCFFNRRDECEIVADTRKYKIEIEKSA